MGRFVDAIRCNILEKYMASNMRERSVDALLVLRNENKWAMTGNFFYIFLVLTFFLDIFSFYIFLYCGFYVVFSFSCRCGSERRWRFYSSSEGRGRL